MTVLFGSTSAPPSTGERLLWEGEPSRRVMIPIVVAASLSAVFLVVALAKSNLTALFLCLALLAITLLLPRLLLSAAGLSMAELFSVKYQLTNQRLIMTRGLWARRTTETDLIYFRATAMSQNGWLRLLGVGTVDFIREVGNPVQLVAVKKPLEAKELARTAIFDRRKSAGVLPVDNI